MVLPTRFRFVAAIALGLCCVPLPAAATTVSATFQVTLTVQKVCSVTAGAGSNIALGTLPATTTNATGSSTISVTCTKTTPYYIGLAPSNAATGGSGVLSGTISGNTDTITYKLSSTAGPSGTVWGNTATSTTVGNGVAGTGTGAAQSLNVYVTVPAMNYTPDSYSDTVTVNVNY
ncbi:spore coat U domain-containing protein [Novosphingobium sp.]|uniref:Csu type fimbrial protein n=1 Tax=Novosphingobium sp. TaxID=1874826 RepID=UPI003B516710